MSRFVAYRMTALARMIAAAVAGASTRGISPCQEDTVGPITYPNTKFNTDG